MQNTLKWRMSSENCSSHKRTILSISSRCTAITRSIPPLSAISHRSWVTLDSSKYAVFEQHVFLGYIKQLDDMSWSSHYRVRVLTRTRGSVTSKRSCSNPWNSLRNSIKRCDLSTSLLHFSGITTQTPTHINLSPLPCCRSTFQRSTWRS